MGQDLPSMLGAMRMGFMLTAESSLWPMGPYYNHTKLNFNSIKTIGDGTLRTSVQQGDFSNALLVKTANSIDMSNLEFTFQTQEANSVFITAKNTKESSPNKLLGKTEVNDPAIDLDKETHTLGCSNMVFNEYGRPLELLTPVDCLEITQKLDFK